MVEAYPDGVTIQNEERRLPIHQVCDCGNNISNLGRKLQILDFLIEEYPESILVKDEIDTTPPELFMVSIEVFWKKIRMISKIRMNTCSFCIR